ncbi:sugar phosphate isomerase/epimerase [Actinoplanes bogorensis]|uniref:Sugar phosphate isomerase/epimerase n=1 Tax=Paractinoplanes bogorensis TaxID=1610840 RepID=A0ABS5Z3T8_9ACTN|nr:sugar phosphate isomerase/epimerase family protein [Actinoplanes bogorensis]MBU2670201.1 sugar phosphate isomerase/epimerase [Actinoplanes bogorensis]
MRIAGHTLGTPDQTVPEALRLFRGAGLDAAEVILQDGYRSGIAPGDPRAVADAAAAATGEGVDIVALTPYTMDINDPGETVRSRAVDELKHAVDVAGELGAGRIRVYAGRWQPGRPDEAAHWAALTRSLQELGAYADGTGVHLCVENHFGTMTQSAVATAKLVREVGSPHVRVLYDQANLTFTHDEGYEPALAVQGDLISHVHVKDLVFTDANQPFHAAGTARVEAEERAVRSRVVGDGILPWQAILGCLQELGYDGILSLEYEYRWHPQDLPDPAEGFRRGAEAVRAILGRLA